MAHYSSAITSSTRSLSISNNGSGSNGSSYSSYTNPSVQVQTQTKQEEPLKPKKRKKRGGYRVHRVSYTAQNHVQILFRTYASAFPKVFPFVMTNVVWTVVIYYLKEYMDLIDLTFHSSVGHSFMGLLVSFLIVSRSKISYDRFMEYRRHLAECYRTCVSIICLYFVLSG